MLLSCCGNRLGKARVYNDLTHSDRRYCIDREDFPILLSMSRDLHCRHGGLVEAHAFLNKMRQAPQ